MGGSNDQIDQCRFCLSRRNFRPGHVARAASSTGRHDQASPPTPKVRRERPRSGTNIWLSTMRGRWHLHVCVTSPDPPPGQPQALPIRLRYRTEPGAPSRRASLPTSPPTFSAFDRRSKKLEAVVPLVSHHPGRGRAGFECRSADWGPWSGCRLR